MVAGFAVQILLGALSFLVPAVSTTTPQRHAAMRHSLGRQATLRLAAWNGGVAVLSLGVGLDAWVVAAAGAAVLVTTLGATLVLLGLSLLEAR
jgi:nitrite reductase (NO-forming)